MKLSRKLLRKMIIQTLNESNVLFPFPGSNTLDQDIEKEAAYAGVRIIPGMTYRQIIDAIEASQFQLTPDMSMPAESPGLQSIKDRLLAYESMDDVFGDGQAVYDRFVK